MAGSRIIPTYRWYCNWRRCDSVIHCCFSYSRSKGAHMNPPGPATEQKHLLNSTRGSTELCKAHCCSHNSCTSSLLSMCNASPTYACPSRGVVGMVTANFFRSFCSHIASNTVTVLNPPLHVPRSAPACSSPPVLL